MTQYGSSGGSSATQIVGTQMGADGREFRPPRASGPQRINPRIGGSRERGHESEIENVVRQYRSGRLDGRAAVAQINRITGWGRNRANEILLYAQVSGTTAPGAISGGGTPLAGGAATAAGAAGGGAPSTVSAQSIFGEDAFDTGLPVELEDIFGTAIGRQAEFGNMLSDQFGNVNQGARNFLDRQREAADISYFLNFAGGGTPRYTDYIKNLKPGGLNLPTVPSMDVLNNAADVLRAGPQGISSGGGPLSQADAQRVSFAQGFSGQPLQQFQMALQPALGKLPGWAQGAFQGAADQRFDTLLSRFGQDPNFQVLPFLQERGFNPFASFA